MIHRIINHCPKLWRYPLARFCQYAASAVRHQHPSHLLAGAAIVPATMMFFAWIISLLAPMWPWLCALISISYIAMAVFAWFIQR